MNILKNILTAFIGFICCFASLFAIVVCVSGVDAASYRVQYKLTPTLTDVTCEYIGTSYEDYPNYEKKFYRITYTVKNETNYGMEENHIRLRYKNITSGLENDYIGVYDEERGGFPHYQDGMYYPPGKTGTFSHIVCVDQESTKLSVNWSNASYYKAGKAPLFEIDL